MKRDKYKYDYLYGTSKIDLIKTDSKISFSHLALAVVLALMLYCIFKDLK